MEYEEELFYDSNLIAEKIGEAIDGEDLLAAWVALCSMIGCLLEENLVGKYNNFEDINSALKLTSMTIRAAYNDCLDLGDANE